MSEPYRDRPPLEGDDDAVMVATYSAAVEAEMNREYLKDHGIVAAVHESASFNPLINMAAGGVRLVVRGRDEGRARSLLARLRRESGGPGEDDDGEDGEVRCPRCESTYCFHERAFKGDGHGPVPGAVLVLLPFIAASGKRWRCHKCTHVWDDPKEGPAKATPLHPDDPRPVFRLRRHRAGSGLLLGLLALAIGGMLLASARLPGAVLPLLLAPIVGYFLGRRATTDVCSAPGCRAELAAGRDTCPQCRGAIAGVIRSAPEHYSEAAAVRRELAALRAADEAKRLGAKEPASAPKKRKKKAPRAEP